MYPPAARTIKNDKAVPSGKFVFKIAKVSIVTALAHSAVSVIAEDVVCDPVRHVNRVGELGWPSVSPVVLVTIVVP